ncbi:SDR family oxidoreductase [Pseudoxanthomonas sp. JBR18]|uniref:SDR family NAD(P)-dependent oxidoreductase n=1 Tax=Pseudoxanthomonas sp. JBR18 TaxID=2969308 RepID=UPI002FE09496
MAKRFDGKVIVVTGGSDGIGLASAQAFAQEGGTVYICARRKERLDEVLDELGSSVTAVQCDVGNPEDLDRLYAQIRQDQGRVDVVFANAGVSESAALGEIDEAHVDRLLSTNIKGVIHTVQKALPLMGRGATVIITGSGAGSSGFAGLSVYSATKAALRSFARTWTTDLKDRGIRVNAVSPGMIKTPAMDRYLDNNPGTEAFFEQLIPMARLGHWRLHGGLRPLGHAIAVLRAGSKGQKRLHLLAVSATGSTSADESAITLNQRGAKRWGRFA